jgi:putative ABC transport system permease protein
VTARPFPLRAASRICGWIAAAHPSDAAGSTTEVAGFLEDALADAWRVRRWRGAIGVVKLAIVDLVRARLGHAALPLRVHTAQTPERRARSSFMDRFINDLRHSTRTLIRTPAFTTVAVLTLALGIGATTAVYAVVDGVLLRPFPYPHMARLMMLTEVAGTGQIMSISWPNYQDWRAQNDVFEELGVFRSLPVALAGGETPERLNGSFMSSSIFASVGLAPLAGRTLNASDDAPGAARVAVISERLWRTRFGARDDIVGLPATLNSQPFTIAGVMPAGMRFPGRTTDVWLPLGLFVDTFPKARGAHPGLYGLGRLKAGVDVERARAGMTAIAKRLSDQYPDSNRNNGIVVTPYYEQIVENIRPVLRMLLGAVAMLLLIACSNLASLMLARSESRHRELAVRAALGANRMRLVTQTLAESALLAGIGGALGVGLATLAVRAFVGSQPTTIPRIDLLGIDWRVLTFAVIVSALTVVLFGLIPALRGSRPDLQFALRTTRGTSLRSVRLRRFLVGAQIAVATVLLVGAGLFARSLGRLTSIELGFDPARVVAMRLTLPDAKYNSPEAWVGFHRTLLDKLAGLPAAEAIAINSGVPLEGGASESPVIKEGDPPPSRDRDTATCLFQVTGGDYFRAMGIPVLRGRAFDARDAAGAAPVVIVDEALASHLFGSESPVGRRIAFEFKGHDQGAVQPIWRELVGVVRHVKHYGLTVEPTRNQVYVPVTQLPVWMETRRPPMAILVRTAADSDAMVSTIRRAVAGIDAGIPVYGVQTMAGYVAQATEQQRLSAILVSAFAGLALVLAALGVYGVLAYVVSQRTREIGVRVALGARRGDIVRQIVSQGAILTAAGLVIGLLGAIALGSVVRTLLYEVSPRDLATFAGSAIVLAVVATAASLIPARRASSVDPLVALRTE